MKKGPPRTPTMLRTGYELKPSRPKREPRRTPEHPQLGPEPDPDALDSWLAHVLAGRIQVR